MSSRLRQLGLAVVLLTASAFIIRSAQTPVVYQPIFLPTGGPVLPTLAVLPTLTALGAGPVTSALGGTAPQSTPTVHIVQRGESLYRIAQDYGVSVAEIIASNNLADPETIYAGQTLLIPPPGVVTVPPAPTWTLPPLLDAPVLSSAALPALPTPAATVLPPAQLNGLPLDAIIVLPPETIARSREIYALGQALGRNPRAFSRLGDSTIESPHFLARFDGDDYNLGPYAYLQPVIDVYRGSFSREGVAVRRGLHSWSVLDSMWADKGQCQPAESMLACELRLNNPSLLFIRLGSNDVGVPESFERSLRQIIEFCLTNGALPILGTKADRHEGADNINNTIIRQLAAEYALPLWDFDLVAQTLPDRGLTTDGVHLTTYYAHDYTAPVAFRRGHGLHNLTALLMLDALWRALAG